MLKNNRNLVLKLTFGKIRDDDDMYRSAASTPEMNIKTAGERWTGVAGVDVGIKNMFAVSYINREGELRQTVIGGFPGWIANCDAKRLLSKITGDCKKKGSAGHNSIFGPLFDSPKMFPGSLSLIAMLRNRYIIESIREAVSRLTSLLAESGVYLIAVERNMKNLCISDLNARESYCREFETTDVVTFTQLFKAICTELLVGAAAAGIGTVSVDERDTSRICAKCGGRLDETDLRKNRRFVTCGSCGTVWARDCNASVNIMMRGIYEAAETKSRSAIAPVAAD